uniref:Secreted protein n=1 Tax=Romanomermis culicivorax TaxID=13658 RepID=A0A915IZK7_ROMCU
MLRVVAFVTLLCVHWVQLRPQNIDALNTKAAILKVTTKPDPDRIIFPDDDNDIEDVAQAISNREEDEAVAQLNGESTAEVTTYVDTTTNRQVVT